MKDSAEYLKAQRNCIRRVQELSLSLWMTLMHLWPQAQEELEFVDSMGTIFPECDNDRTLGVVPGEDSFRKLTQEEIEAENQSSSEVEDETPDEDNGMTIGM